MKLIVQIPCFNEEATIAEVVRDVPRELAGVSCVKVLVVDDGSTDRTAEVAREAGADFVVRHRRNRGLAVSFVTGLENCLRLGADIIVNTDGDHQYCGAEIARLVAPIVAGDADLVIGDRGAGSVPHFSWLKRVLQRLGGFVARWLSNTDVTDPVSGFRAFSRECALRMHVHSRFSYTTETLIQAGQQGLDIVCVPVTTNRPTRPSRLFRSLGQFVFRSGGTMIRAFAMYRPLMVFGLCSAAFVVVGAIPIFRFLYLAWLVGNSAGHIQSLVLGSALVVVGVLLLIAGLMADVLACQRQLLERMATRVCVLESRVEKLAEGGDDGHRMNESRGREEGPE